MKSDVRINNLKRSICTEESEIKPKRKISRRNAIDLSSSGDVYTSFGEWASEIKVLDEVAAIKKELSGCQFGNSWKEKEKQTKMGAELFIDILVPKLESHVEPSSFDFVNLKLFSKPN